MPNTLNNLKFLEPFNTAYTSLTNKELDANDFQKGDSEGLVNYGLSLKGAKFAVIFIEHKEEGIIKISFRSKGTFDVNNFARTHFNGGGHKNASGGRSNLNLEDTIAKFISNNEFTGANSNIEIFDQNGNNILTLTPKISSDSTSTIKSIQINTERFKTAKNLNIKSTFKVIKDNYKISSIQNTIRNIVITVNEINAFFTIDKNELPAELRFDMNLKIEAVQIPDEAKIKGFFIQWD